MASTSVDVSVQFRALADQVLRTEPEKLRTLLKGIFIPDFKPTFIDDKSLRLPGINDIELLGPSTTKGRSPYRMWKGEEVDYKYVSGVQQKAAELPEKYKDTELIKAKCRQDIEKQREMLEMLPDVVRDSKLRQEGDVVRSLLRRSAHADSIKKRLDNCKKALDSALTDFRYAEVQTDVFDDLLKEVGVDENTARADPDRSVISRLEDKVNDARVAFRNAEQAYLENRENEEFVTFYRNSKVGQAVDEMKLRLQHWRSAIKIEQSIEQAKIIFNDKLFSSNTVVANSFDGDMDNHKSILNQTAKKRYLWLDTCCIDKKDPAELNDSLSLMGDWYKDADFCLVYLEGPGSQTEWIDEWDRFKRSTLQEANIKSFRSIHEYEPEWATRGWTLQELVMSKTTFYLNSAWKPLSRPVEYLGPYYYSSPFIDLYIGQETNNIFKDALKSLSQHEALDYILDKGGMQNPCGALENGGSRTSSEHPIQQQQPQTQDREDAKAITAAKKLLTILEVLGMQIPQDMDKKSAVSQMAQAVYVAAMNLSSQSNGHSNAHNLLRSLMDFLQSYGPIGNSTVHFDRNSIVHAINMLLQCFVTTTMPLIKQDREYIAEFGGIHGLKNWQDGVIRMNFSAHTVMPLACIRDSGVETDRVYSLMGLLNVRFPTFHAEGLTKALARLLDEVLVSWNDVSIFNWSGPHFGSPIRGRSLYPSVLEAFKVPKINERDFLAEKTAELSKRFEIERYTTMVSFQKSITVLKEAITFVKEGKETSFLVDPFKKILEFVKTVDFKDLEPCLDLMRQFMQDIQKNLSTPRPAKESSDDATAKPPKLAQSFMKEGSSLATKVLPPRPSLGFDVKAAKKGFGRPGLSLGKRGSNEESTPAKNISDPDLAISPSSTFSEAETLVEREQEDSRQELEKQKFDLVAAFIGKVEGITTNSNQNAATTTPLPPPIPPIPSGTIETTVGLTASEPVKPRSEPEDMICPNPIIVTNSGIEGTFDIQRVIITMLVPDKLKRQIQHAASNDQKISGWCMISTGFALTLVGFSCEKHILQKQLDVVNAVENKVLREQKDGQKRNRLMSRVKTSSFGIKSPSSSIQEDNASKSEENPQIEVTDEGDAQEAKKVSRMIQFVQEQRLDAIAGEWVLARFSGVPGAKWFLCNLELGLTHQYYGHRIATTEIDFHNAAPEKGLKAHWETYMRRKKRKLCGLLKAHLQTKDADSFKAELSKELTKMMKKDGDDKPKGEPEDDLDDIADGNDSDDEPSFFNQKLEQMKEKGRQAAVKAGGFLFEKFWEMRADHLDKNLSASVLKKTPTYLQAALESLNDNRSLLPSMYLTAKVHMF
ncbi:uncharacterized protein Z519_03637 [Cladophialophora bantiana CBS 173.52]|uniref:Heterokaryon incompatibility domain-containing protein n=1 Tax=Cladophialophora bantiana (strain ATCC 10958 / CBS 173.52 / CDC B-1940 / NIH 8579) TaxID=1442370 RepID=A0A0D2EYM3_CLAB1|nr:uncharacterized protein Z519_03637 [Cladophialophora bantiana CBS 173.52]KIW95056.1 hypothetical protein Z519_03637 [Cladophialophora bantiana CBS 173.52]